MALEPLGWCTVMRSGLGALNALPETLALRTNISTPPLKQEAKFCHHAVVASTAGGIFK